ncbi:MFS transporter [Petropleomorpha daqingensis]|uniref:MFS family permease n=1 Tax=Petropleomorpha daqingensis TaxID=2026353 RepID=A0A853CH37_9ACTN|nr:MFS family permease [Petropleomorpha daqingensis]
MSRLGPRFWRLYASSATSNLADGIGRTALPLLAASYTRDPVLVSGLASFAFLPWLLFALVSGAVVDRVDRRYAMSAANAVRALSLGVLAVLVMTGEGSVLALYVVAFLLGTAETIYDSATRALLPQVIERRHMDKANSLLTAEESLGQQFIGSPLGSALFALAVALPIALNSIGFAVAALLILTVRGVQRPQRTGGPTTVRADVAEGVRWLWNHRLLRGFTLVSAATCLTNSMINGVLVLYVLEVLHLQSSRFGFFVLSAGVGALLGGLATPLVGKLLGRVRALTLGAAVSAAAIGLMGFVDNGWVAAALSAVMAAGVMVWNVLTMSLRQLLIPEHMFGRVQGAYRTLVWGAIPLGALAGGVVADLLGVSAVFLVSGAVLLVLAGVLWLLLRAHAAELTDEALAGEDADEAVAVPA